MKNPPDHLLNIVMCTLSLLLCTPVVRSTQSASTLHCGLKSLWTQPPSLHHFLSVMHETGGSKMEATSPHSQNHLGPWISSYVLPQPPSGAQSDVKVLSTFTESGTLHFPRERKLQANAYFLSWAAVSLKVCPTFKGFGPLTIKGWHSWDCGRAVASALSLIWPGAVWVILQD